jgi:hypothetical protein
LIRIETNSTSYFLGPVGTSDPREFIAAESQRIPFKAALSGPPLWKDAFKNWPLPQLPAGEIGIKGYLQIIAPRPAIGTVSASLNSWNYPWPIPQRMKIF